MWALVMANDSCLFCFVVLILGVDKGSPEGVGTLEMYLNVSSFAQSFEFVSSVGDVGNNNGGSELIAVVLVVVRVWMPVEACHVKILILLCFSSVPDSSNMYQNKDSKLKSDLRDKYGENSVSLFRKWENRPLTSIRQSTARTCSNT